MTPIPQEWIRDYVDKLIEVARTFDNGPMRQAAADRANYIMDMVRQFQLEKKENIK